MKMNGEFLWPVFVPMVVLFALVAFFMIKNIRLIASSTRVMGTIIDFETEEDREGKIMTAQRVAYRDRDNHEREVLARVRSNPPSGKVGERIAVYIPLDTKSPARVGTFMELWLGATVFAVIGGIFLIIWFGTWVGPPPKV